MFYFEGSIAVGFGFQEFLDDIRPPSASDTGIFSVISLIDKHLLLFSARMTTAWIASDAASDILNIDQYLSKIN